jgi:glucose repression regulatory protein TUP1
MMTGIKIWNIVSKTVLHTLHGHTQEVYSLDWAKDVIASGSGDQQVRLWDSKTGQCLHVLTDPNGPTEGVTSVTLSPDAVYVAAGSLDHVIRLWNVKTGQQIESLTGHTESVYSIAIFQDGSSNVSGSVDKTVRLWDNARPGEKPKAPAVLGTSDPDWWHHPDIAPHRRAVGASESDLRKAPQPADLSRLLLCAPFHTDFVLSVGFSPDGRWIITGSKDRSVVFWDKITRRSVLKQMGYKNSVISVSSASGWLVGLVWFGCGGCGCI